MTLKKGEILRTRYLITRVIGQGGMGNIYLAEDNRLKGRVCAVKEVIHDQSLGEKLIQQAKKQFFQEASVLARLDHPNLPKVSDYFSSDNRDFLVMDYVAGDDLRTLMLKAKRQNKYLKESDVLKWAIQIGEALTYLHTQNPPIVHRDIKPGNIKLTPSGLVKLVDFGLVKILAPGDVTITILQGQGTALYTPLEQYGGYNTHTDIRSDIYAFASTLYHLLTNNPPTEARERFLSPQIQPSIRSINPSIRINTEKAIECGMRLHPDDRPDSVNEFIEDLTGQGDRDGLKTSEHIYSQLNHSLTDRKLAWISLGLTALAFIISLI